MDAGVQNTGTITDEEVSVIQDTWRPVYEVKEDCRGGCAGQMLSFCVQPTIALRRTNNESAWPLKRNFRRIIALHSFAVAFICAFVIKF
ncbi:hypothetical protein E1301_Tti016263 [Triplophysa tibetana]|uniref:Uncharacterized protein n=1 Tax=Triplophysa tibetana TaxID=1572043 RepID=A0A5A9N8G2_9TELE|nr:hypothetical protein E1301_Tti016263 [Triplophysa tibetana]